VFDPGLTNPVSAVPRVDAQTLLAGVIHRAGAVAETGSAAFDIGCTHPITADHHFTEAGVAELSSEAVLGGDAGLRGGAHEVTQSVGLTAGVVGTWAVGRAIAAVFRQGLTHPIGTGGLTGVAGLGEPVVIDPRVLVFIHVAALLTADPQEAAVTTLGAGIVSDIIVLVHLQHVGIEDTAEVGAADVTGAHLPEVGLSPRSANFGLR
jgi:hypothetical protein